MIALAAARPARELFAIEVKLFLREPFAIFFTLGMPLMMMIVFSSVFGDEVAGYEDFTVADLIQPAAVATILGYLGLMGIPIALAEYREMGVLRRFKASPLGIWSLMAAHLAVQFVFFVVGSAVVIGASALLFGTRFRGDLLAFLGVALTSALAMFAIGFLLVGLTRGARTAQAVGVGLFFPMLFLSGATIPRSEFPDWLFALSEFVPLSMVVDNLGAAWIGMPFAGDNWLAVLYLLVIAGAAALFSKRLFRWD